MVGLFADRMSRAARRHFDARRRAEIRLRDSRRAARWASEVAASRRAKGWPS